MSGEEPKMRSLSVEKAFSAVLDLSVESAGFQKTMDPQVTLQANLGHGKNAHGSNVLGGGTDDETGDLKSGGVMQNNLVHDIPDEPSPQEALSYSQGQDFLRNLPYAKDAQHQAGYSNVCLEGTRKSVLDGIKRWAEDSNAPRIYWLRGLAGTGKSAISRTIAESMSNTGQLGASFFCSEDLSDPSLIFPTLAVQLTRRYPEFRSQLISIMPTYHIHGLVSLKDQLNCLIVAPFQRSHIASTVIIIDGLDECQDKESYQYLLSALRSFVSEAQNPEFNLKILITARPSPQIDRAFRSVLEHIRKFSLNKVESNQVNSDIRRFFAKNLRELDKIPDEWPTEQQLDNLCKRTAGLFVYAMAIVNFIGKMGENPTDQLDLLLTSPDSESLLLGSKIGPGKETTLGSYYVSILRESFRLNISTDNPGDCSILGAMTFSANPLPLSTIAMLSGLPLHDTRGRLRKFESFLIIQEGDNGFVKPHRSLTALLANSIHCSGEPFSLSPPIHHKNLLLRCLKIMLAGELSDEIGGPVVDTITLEHAHMSWRGHYAGMMLSDRVPEDTQCNEAFSQAFDIVNRPHFLDDNTEDGVKAAECGLKVVEEWLKIEENLGHPAFIPSKTLIDEGCCLLAYRKALLLECLGVILERRMGRFPDKILIDDRVVRCIDNALEHLSRCWGFAGPHNTSKNIQHLGPAVQKIGFLKLLYKFRNVMDVRGGLRIILVEMYDSGYGLGLINFYIKNASHG